MYHLGEDVLVDSLLLFLTKLNKEDCLVVTLPFFEAISMGISKNIIKIYYCANSRFRLFTVKKKIFKSFIELQVEHISIVKLHGPYIENKQKKLFLANVNSILFVFIYFKLYLSCSAIK